MERAPKVTVLMPVYNGERYLRKAIESILAQSFTDFEFLIIDDGSTDASADIALSYPDPRIRLVRNDANMGLVATLNRGLELARGEYLARMDCDDVSMPERLKEQSAFMDENREIGVCGCWYSVMDGHGTEMRTPEKDEEMRWYLTVATCFAHPCVMMRSGVLRRHGLKYDSRFLHAEDYDLWTRMAQHTRLANIPKVLFGYRVHENQIGARFRDQQIRSANEARRRQLLNQEVPFTPDQLEMHNRIAVRDHAALGDCLDQAAKWLEMLSARAGGDAAIFQAALAETFVEICRGASRSGLKAFFAYVRSPLSRHGGVDVDRTFRIFAVSLFHQLNLSKVVGKRG